MRLVQHDATTNRPHHSGQYDEQPNASDVLFMTRIIHQNNLQLKKQTNCVTNIPNKKYGDQIKTHLIQERTDRIENTNVDAVRQQQQHIVSIEHQPFDRMQKR